MYEVFKASKPFMEVVSSRFDLTPQQVFAIKTLEGGKPVTMSDFARMLGCDASNVTSIADKLETRGILERRPSASDRRVKVLMLTSAGLELHGRISDAMQTAPPAIANLSLEDQKELAAIFRRGLDSL